MAQKNAPLRLSFSNGELVVSAQTPDVGEASEPLPAPFAGEPFEIGFNPDFLRDGVDETPGEKKKKKKKKQKKKKNRCGETSCSSSSARCGRV